MDGNVHREILSLEIIGGIEWFTIDGQEKDCQCARCGSSAGWADCADCGGDGYKFFTDYDDPDLDEYLVRCHECRGNGGSWHCISSPDWCKEHPLPGRENVESTAISSEAWADAL